MTRSTTADWSLLTAWASASRSSSGPAGVVCGEQHAAPDDELVGVGRHAEPREPALDDVQGQEFLGRSSFCPGPVLQVEVSLAGRRRSCRPLHPALAMSTASLTGPYTSSAAAILSSAAGCASRRLRYRRRAARAACSRDLIGQIVYCRRRHQADDGPRRAVRNREEVGGRWPAMPPHGGRPRGTVR